MEKIKAVVESFVRGGDNNDPNLLEAILHPHFQNVQDGFFAEKGIYVFSKDQYIDLVRSKKFGGSTRSIEFVSIEQLGNIAIAKVILESQKLKFFSVVTCVCNNDKWEVINNIPKVEVKS